MNLIIGAGSVGTVLAGYLLHGGQPVQLQVRAAKAESIRTIKRLEVINAANKRLIDVPAPEIVTGDTVAQAENIFLCIKRADLAAVLNPLAQWVKPQTVILPCCNGVDLERAVNQFLPGNAIAPATIMFNARIEAPLHARLTTRPEILVGGDAPQLHKLFRAGGMKSAKANAATEWGKLLINLNNALCALTNRTFSDLFGAEKVLMQSFILVLDEAVALLEKAQIPYSMPAPVSYPAYRWLLLNGRGLPLWIARRKNGLSDQAYPSMHADLEQGRLTEVDYLNGAVVELARKLELEAPVNAKLVKLMHEREVRPTAPAWSPANLLAALEQA